MRDGLDLGGGSDRLVGSKTSLGVDKVSSEDGVDEGGFSESGLTFTAGQLKHLELSAVLYIADRGITCTYQRK